jgi:hypothetical protein
MPNRTAIVALALLSLGAAAACVAACGGDAAAEASDARMSPDRGAGLVCSVAAQSCVPAVDVESARQVVDAIVAVKESRDSERTAGNQLGSVGSSGADLAPTNDLRATMDIEIAIADYPELDPPCACAERATFSAAPLAGVTCLEKPDGGSGCLRIRIANGTVFRAKRVLTGGGMFSRGVAHVVTLLDACTTPCTGPGRAWCGASATCIPLNEFCALCDGKGLAACACQKDCVAKAEGATCEYNTSQDTFETGICTGGDCR